MIKNIIFLYEVPFTEWHYKRLGIATLLTAGFNVIILDCTRWINYSFNERYKLTRIENKIVKDIGNKEELKDALKLLLVNEHSILFDTLSFSIVCSIIRFKVYNKKNILTAKWNLGLIPACKSSKFSELYIILLHKDKLFLRLFNRIIRFLTEKIIDPPHIAILSGKLSLSGSLKKSKFKIWAHSFDYDHYIDVEKNAMNITVGSKYIVYLDEDIIDHPDLTHSGHQPVTKACKFFPKLNYFFEELELRLGMQVVIAAHPKSHYDLSSSPFDRRTIHKGLTPELVKNSSLVLGHASCSFNFAMLYKKPICILTSNDLKESYLNCWINARANISQATLYNIDDTKWEINESKLMMVDNDLYTKYCQQYIKFSSSDNENIWEIFNKSILNFLPQNNK